MRTIRKSLMLIALMAMGTATVQAQDLLGSILGTVKEAVGNKTTDSTTSKKSTKKSSASTATSTAGSILSGLSTIFSSSKVATADKLVGTWVYQEPAIVFESSNVLKQAGGSLVSSSIEKKLQKTLEKYGIKKGKMKMTFDKDGNFTQTISGKTLKGTYTIDGKEVKLTYTGGVSQMVGTTQVDGSSLLIVMDASKLLKYAGTLGSLSGSSSLSTVGSLLGSFDGMQCGLRLKKN